MLVGRALQFSPCANAALPSSQRVFPHVQRESLTAELVAAALLILSGAVEKDLAESFSLPTKLL